MWSEPGAMPSAFTGVCETGSVADPVRNAALHVERSHQQTSASRLARRKPDDALVDRRDRLSVLFRDLRRLLRRGQRDSDARSDEHTSELQSRGLISYA